MSSEAAAYFPDALASASEVRGPAQGAAAIPSNLLDDVQSNTSEACADTVIPIAEVPDESLLERVGQGDKEALAILFRRHARTVRNVACRILRDEAEADDLAQDIFIFVFRKAALYKASHGSARSWIVQATYHRAFNRRIYLNTRHFYTNRNLEDVVLAVSNHQYEASFANWSLEGVLGTESAARLREFLSPSQLSTIELHFFEGYTLEEIADGLGQNLGNIRNHYYRGLEKLRKPAFANRLRSK
jgi:RNA polymerase sigma-70 factor (ECF subfamily)